MRWDSDVSRAGWLGVRMRVSGETTHLGLHMHVLCTLT